jgi:hypothetical protein
VSFAHVVGDPHKFSVVGESNLTPLPTAMDKQKAEIYDSVPGCLYGPYRSTVASSSTLSTAVSRLVTPTIVPQILCMDSLKRDWSSPRVAQMCSLLPHSRLWHTPFSRMPDITAEAAAK